jgi:hypothetical protein
MKKLLLLVPVLLLGMVVTAQKYDDVKNMVLLQQFKKAKEDLDKNMGNAKYTSKPEAFLLKATIYAALANDPTVKGTTAGDQLLSDAEAAFKKYKEMDPSMALVTAGDPAYSTGVANLHSALFSSGYKDYEAKNWTAGFDKFKRVVDLSDMLIARKIYNVPADTNSILLAGIMAESANMKDEAAKYYGKLADIKAGGPGFEGIYRYLVNYYAGKKDMANFDKYKGYGKELYPNSEYFKYDKVDFAVGLEEDFDKKISALEETIAADPTNYKATILLGELIYDTLNSRKEGAVQPSNADQLEKKMVAALYKAAEMKPEDELPYIYVGDHFINKSIRANDAREAHVNDMKARTKPGTAASKEDVAKRDALDKQYGEALLAARDPYEKAAAVFAKKPAPATKKEADINKQQYKKVAGYLADIATYQKNKSKGKPADVTKYTAEEKKWNDVYDSIK